MQAMNPAPNPQGAPAAFTPYQKFIAGLMAFLQFAVILDFMVMSPLGAMIMPALQITPTQFGMVVSAYAFAAGVSGVVTAGFADRYDRKKLLLFFYTGFVLSTLWCGLANTFETLLAARIVTGIFGGVIGSIGGAIVIDLFAPQLRGRVMGLIQTSFAASQVLGLPAALYLSTHWDWHAPFLVLVGLGVLGGIVLAWRMQPVADHLKLKQEKTALAHMVHTAAEARYSLAFITMALLPTGGYMLMPFGSAFSVNNLGLTLQQLPLIYLITGLFTIFVGPLVGRITDKVGVLPVFMGGSALTILMVLIYTHLGVTPFWWVVAINVTMFVGIFSRMIPFQVLVSTVPDAAQRGSFTALSASLQQLSGGVSSLIAGHIVGSTADGKLLHFEWIGYVVVGTTLLSVYLVFQMQRGMRERAAVAANPV